MSICEVDIDGTKRYYLNGLLHREDGAAIEYVSGNRYWCQHGRLHRLDGPAIQCTNGDKYWYLHGQIIECSSQEEFERLLKLKVFW